jgi:hypothetical protein
VKKWNVQGRGFKMDYVSWIHTGTYNVYVARSLGDDRNK